MGSAEWRRSGFLARRAFRRVGLAGAGAAAQVFFRTGRGLPGGKKKTKKTGPWFCVSGACNDCA
jgi:hypothetical protein